MTATEVNDTVKEVEKGLAVKKTVSGGFFWPAQSPQTFRRDWLQKGYASAGKKKWTVKDDSEAVELIGGEVRLVPASLMNIKIRTANDFNLAMSLLKLSMDYLER